jgi:hypothetical protein
MLVVIKMDSNILHQWVSTNISLNLLTTLFFTCAISAGGPADILSDLDWIPRSYCGDLQFHNT